MSKKVWVFAHKFGRNPPKIRFEGDGPAHGEVMKNREVLLFMLILGRNPGDSIVINGNITIKFFKDKGDAFKVAIDAPKDVKIVRGEVDERQKEREAKFAFLDL